MEYSITEGKKLGTHNYSCQGYLYTRSSSSDKCIYLRCALWRSHGIECRGFGRINNECNFFYLTQNHCHTEEAYKSKLIALNNKIKRAAENSTDSLRQVFDQVTASDEAGAWYHTDRYVTQCSKEDDLNYQETPNIIKNLKIS